MKKSLFLRTDVLPAEIPILFDNKNLYKSFTKNKITEYVEIFNKINNIETIPYFFNISKNSYSDREMALLHPLAQLQVYIYTLKYEQLVIEFCSKSKFSVRSPSKLNSFKFNQVKGLKALRTRLNEQYSFSKDISVTTEEDKSLYFNYYSYKPYKNLKDMHNSPKFNRLKYKYNYYIKLDIQNFFSSIYSHSLAWAIFGDKSLAKKNRQKTSFANDTDHISQIINFKETNGLIIGPEFARVIAELLLTRLDIQLYKELKFSNLLLYRDYVIYRYIDDFYVFTKNETVASYIEDKLAKLLQEYNLQLNIHKRSVQKRPFKTYNDSIVSLKSIFSEFISNNLYFFLKNNKNLQKLFLEHNTDMNGSNDIFIPPTPSNWEKIFHQIEKLVYENIDDSRKIVNYALKSISHHLVYQGGSPWNILKPLEIVSNIYTLDINYKSTVTLISIYIKILMQAEEHNKTLDDTSSVEKINETLFHHSYSILKNNFMKIREMHNLIIFMKKLNKHIDSQFLCKILDEYQHNYFILCSVAYYILNEKLTDVDSRYKVVLHKLVKIINSYFYYYNSKGTNFNGLEGDYFYVINDFSYYPGFKQSFKTKLKESLKKVYTQHFKNLVTKGVTSNVKEVNKHLDELDLNQKVRKKEREYQKQIGEIWDYMTNNSYFQWDKKTEYFWRKIVKKTMNISYNNTNNY